MRFLAAKRALLAAGTAFLAINLCTGAPLLALWVGSRVVGQRQITMTAVFLVVVVMAALMAALVLGILWLSATYNRITGQPQPEERLTWLGAWNVKQETVSNGLAASMLERIVMATTCTAVVLFILWFFVFARSPLPAV